MGKAAIPCSPMQMCSRKSSSSNNQPPLSYLAPPTIPVRLEAIALRLEAIASRMDGLAPPQPQTQLVVCPSSIRPVRLHGDDGLQKSGAVLRTGAALQLQHRLGTSDWEEGRSPMRCPSLRRKPVNNNKGFMRCPRKHHRKVRWKVYPTKRTGPRSCRAIEVWTTTSRRKH